MTSGATNPILQQARTHLILGRVSNLPTIWSNCIAAWVLAHGGFTPALIYAMAAMSCLYVGGMYLNDACDAPYDAQYKKDRPIPRGLIHRTHVFIIAGILLLAGLMLSFSWGWTSLAGAFVLVTAIITYNAFHLYLSWSPVLMGLCRTLVYIAVGLAADGDYSFSQLLIWALALGAYVVGFSYIARVEDSNKLIKWTPLLLIFIPAILNLFPLNDPSRIIVSLFPIAWICYCLLWVVRPACVNYRRAVGGLIAGIALVDLLAVSQIGSPNPIIWQVLILCCFILALLGQRFIPAT